MALVALLPVALALGCASPGQPQPPSLRLPALAEKLAAARVGDHLDLTWTTPATTTDGDRAKGTITAVVCVESAPSPTESTANPSKRAVKAEQRRAALAPGLPPSSTPGCQAVEQAQTSPGSSQMSVKLATALATGPPTLLAARVELYNDVSRSAGASAPVFFAGGAAPAEVGTLTISARREGALVQWPPVSSPSSPSVMELKRELKAAPADPAKPVQVRKPGAPQSKAPSRLVILRPDLAAAFDPGGMLDPSAGDGNTYSYTAQRVQTVTLAGHTLELHSEPSTVATFTFHDTFPPKPPSGLVLVPGGGFGEAPSIDLSWDANLESDMLGYNVYRSHASGAFERLTEEPVPAPAFRDLHVQPGERYTYRVTAVDQRHNESAPSATVMESLRK